MYSQATAFMPTSASRLASISVRILSISVPPQVQKIPPPFSPVSVTTQMDTLKAGNTTLSYEE
jgi:hypothetical protein